MGSEEDLEVNIVSLIRDTCPLLERDDQTILFS
jgi:hypothetical protein